MQKHQYVVVIMVMESSTETGDKRGCLSKLRRPQEELNKEEVMSWWVGDDDIYSTNRMIYSSEMPRDLLYINRGPPIIRTLQQSLTENCQFKIEMTIFTKVISLKSCKMRFIWNELHRELVYALLFKYSCMLLIATFSISFKSLVRNVVFLLTPKFKSYLNHNAEFYKINTKQLVLLRWFLRMYL